MTKYVQIHRRRREGVTDYRARKKAILSRRTLLVVRVSGKNVSAQFVKPQVGGDLVLASVHSRALRKLKWNGSLKSVPACYLLGLLAAKKAKEKGVTEAILYNGVSTFVRGSRVAAFAKGVRDAGVEVPMSEEAFPKEEILKGEAIASYARGLLKNSREIYQSRFSSLLKAGFKPEEYPTQFEKAKLAILGGGKK
jgi:large subunit ribosomal protein L18